MIFVALVTRIKRRTAMQASVPELTNRTISSWERHQSPFRQYVSTLSGAPAGAFSRLSVECTDDSRMGMIVAGPRYRRSRIGCHQISQTRLLTRSRGCPPTDLNAPNGELTPPGIGSQAQRRFLLIWWF